MSDFDDYINNNYNETSVSNVVDELTQTPPDKVTIVNEDYELNKELERRLELAYLYRLILNENLFEGDDSECKRVVESEIRAFIRSRLEFLMGIKKEPIQNQQVELPFDKEEMAVLKALIKAARKKPEIAENVKIENKPQPSLKKVSNVENKSNATKSPSLRKTTTRNKNSVQPQTQPPVTQQNSTPSYKDGDIIEKGGVQFRIKEVNGVFLEVPIQKPKVVSPRAKPMPSPMQISTLASMEADRRASSTGVLSQIINNEVIKKGE